MNKKKSKKPVSSEDREDIWESDLSNQITIKVYKRTAAGVGTTCMRCVDVIAIPKLRDTVKVIDNDRYAVFNDRCYDNARDLIPPLFLHLNILGADVKP